MDPAGPPLERHRTLPMMTGLDGVRAVAVIAVVLYHLEVGWLPAGFLGVDVFFVVSGFLITVAAGGGHPPLRPVRREAVLGAPRPPPASRR